MSPRLVLVHAGPALIVLREGSVIPTPSNGQLRPVVSRDE